MLGLGLQASDTSLKVVPTKCKVYLQINVQNNCSQMLNVLGNLDQDVALSDSMTDNANEYVAADSSAQEINQNDNSDNAQYKVIPDEQDVADLEAEQVREVAADNSYAPEAPMLSEENRSMDTDNFSIEDVVRALPDICIGLVQDLDVRFEEQGATVEAVVDYSKLEDRKLHEVGIHGNLNVGVSKGVLNLMVSTVKEMSKFRTPDAPRAIISVVALRTLPVPFLIDEKTAVVRHESRMIRVTMQKMPEMEAVTEDRSVEEVSSEVKVPQMMEEMTADERAM